MAGVPVCCHALGGPGLLMAVQAGVDTIEHGGWLDEEVRRGDGAARHLVRADLRGLPLARHDRARRSSRMRARAMREDHLESFALGAPGGGPDRDGHRYRRLRVRRQRRWSSSLLVEAGMTPAEAIEVSTRRSAECMGIADEVGTLARGKEADLIVLDADPLGDIGVLREAKHRALVMKGGAPVAGPLAAAFLAPAP